MTKKLISWLSILTVFLTLLWSCHNEDFAKGEAEPQRNNANFFKHATSGIAKSGVDYINILEEHNRERDFLITMPDQKGMPIWDKMQIMDAGNTTGLMIPLSDDNETMSSVLFATLDDENSVIGVKDYDNNLLKSIVYNDKLDRDFRERMFYTFMYMDNKTFGNEQFTGIPKNLFVGKKYDETYGRIKIKNFEEPGSAASSENGKILWTQMCSMFWQCSHHGEGKCDKCMSLCYVKICNGDVMVFIGDDTEYPMPPTSGGGGGGATPSPDGIPPKDACVQSGMPFYRLAPQCVGNGNGETPNLDNPCAKIKSIVNNAQLKPKIDSLKQYSLTAVENEKGYQQDKSGNVTPALVNGAHHVDFLIDQNSLGGIHCHTLNGTHMFSPPDILTLIRFADAQNQTLPIGSTIDNTENAFLGMISQSGSYFITFNGGSGDLPPPMTQAAEEAFELAMNKAYKEIIIDLLEAEGKHKGDDLSETGLQKLFFAIVKEMGIEGKINLVKENNGNTSTIEQNSDGTIKAPIPC